MTQGLIAAIPFTMILFNVVLIVCFMEKQSGLRIQEMELADNWSDFVVEMMDLRFLIGNFRRAHQVGVGPVNGDREQWGVAPGCDSPVRRRRQ